MFSGVSHDLLNVSETEAKSPHEKVVFLTECGSAYYWIVRARDDLDSPVLEFAYGVLAE